MAIAKQKLLRAIVDHLTARAALYDASARAAHAEATHEESKAEDKYDTRGLEASYLAQGQARQMAEVADALAQFQQMRLRTFGRDEPIDIGALVELTGPTETTLYFIGPCAGGTEVRCGRQAVIVLTLQSPLGAQLAGQRRGAKLKLRFGGRADTFEVTGVT